MILQKASVTKALYETGAFAVVRVPTVERGCEIAEGLIKAASTPWRSATPSPTPARSSRASRRSSATR